MEESKMKRTILIMLLSTLLLSCNNSEKELEREGMNSANMSRAMEALEKEDIAEMTYWIGKEIDANPENGYAFAQLAWADVITEEYGNAITHATTALEHLPKKDKEYVGFAYASRAAAYNHLEQYDKALADYNAAVKAEPDNAGRFYQRGEFLFSRKEYKLSDKDFKECIRIKPGEPLGYVAMGRNAKMQGHHEEAVALYDKAIGLQDDYSSAYAFRAESYIALGRFEEAAADVVTSLSIDGGDKAFRHMRELGDSSYATIVSRLKVQLNMEPNNPYWFYCLGVVSEDAERYDSAIEYYGQAIAKDKDAALYDAAARCYQKMGKYNDALQNINMAIELAPDDLEYRERRYGIYYELNKREALFKEIEYCIEREPDNAWYYHERGWFKDLYGDVNGAIEDLTASITLDPSYAYNYLVRGCAYRKLGNMTAAQKDFSRCIDMDTTDMEELSCAHFAYHYLGDDVNAIRLLDTVLRYDYVGNLYDAACLYSLMGDKEQAINYIRLALEHGYNRFTHIEKDDDMDNIRNEKEFKQLIETYRKNQNRDNAKNEKHSIQYVQRTTNIPFNHRNGVNEVKCTVNGLPLYFIFDTGASDITISSVEAAFMLKNGYLSDKDVIGSKAYRTASGDIVAGTVVNLKKITIGEVELENVHASVVKGQTAPLLLGQSALGKLGKIEIDNHQQAIRITYSKAE